MNIKWKRSDQEIWEIYLKTEDQKKSGLSGAEYCRKHNMDYKQFVNDLYKVDFIRFSKPEQYNCLMDLVEKYHQSEESRTDFIKRNNIKQSHFIVALTHKKYLDVIERMKNQQVDQEEKQMTFIPLRNEPLKQAIVSETTRTPEPEPEVLEAKNSVELIIDKGVRVIVSPEVPPMKLIKIIELLKDL